MRIDRRSFVGSGASLLLAPAAAAATAGPLRPEDFGARGDGATNDSRAFAALAAEVNRRGGGTIVLRKTTYVVGGHRAPLASEGVWGLAPVDVLSLRNLVRPLVIEGNGARLKCATGLRYGTFDPHSGLPIRRATPNYRLGEIASPYRAMIEISGCRAGVSLSGLDLDGNLAGLRIGGPYGDGGYQIPACGIFLRDNRGPERLVDVHSHHHGQDGIEIDGDDRRAARSRFERVVCDHNGRQGLSLIGGRGYDFAACKFNHNGAAPLASAPAAGFDIEAENGKTNRDLSFADCEFAHNAGCGLLADSGDSEGALFTRCTFIGSANWSCWPNKPNFRFARSRFVGAIVNAFGDADPSRAARFEDCEFTDDPAQAGGGPVFLGGWPNGPIANLGEHRNVQFVRCAFVTTKAALPWSVGVVYTDCRMRQGSTAVSYPKGIYRGRNVIAGPADLAGSRVEGEVMLNGRRIAGTRL